jgi:hypothetical protein
MRRGAVALALALVLHAVLMQGLQSVWAPLETGHTGMHRMQATYTRAVQLSEAPVARRAAPLPAPPRRARPPAAPASAASAAPALVPPLAAADDAMTPVPALAASEPQPQRMPEEPTLASGPAPPASASAAAATAVPALPASVASEAGAAPTPVAASASAAAFEWPTATRIRYRLEGQYRGEVTGSASVEWLRQADRYQVHLDVSAAGVFSRRLSSEGRITSAGLVPERYQQVTEVLGGLFSKPRVEEIVFGGPTLRLLNGQEVPTLPRVQDTASQFIQFIYLLTTQPALREPGSVVDVALALPRSARTWRYEAAPSESVNTPAGPVDTVHLRPASGAPPGDWTVEMWFAPRLQMLPVRFRIRQNAEVYFDLFIDRLPEQAGR